MIFRETPLKGAFTIELQPHHDERGQFVRTWCHDEFRRHCIDAAFTQSAMSINTQRGTLRGLHCQVSPNVQGKLVRCVRGAIWDVAVDIRHGSPTFGKHAAAVLSAENWSQLWVPGGFLHGFVTLEPDTEVIYKVTALYSREHEVGIIWNDPDLGIDWPVEPGRAVLSAKDAVLPRLKDLPADFRWSSAT